MKYNFTHQLFTNTANHMVDNPYPLNHRAPLHRDSMLGKSIIVVRYLRILYINCALWAKPAVFYSSLHIECIVLYHICALNNINLLNICRIIYGNETHIFSFECESYIEYLTQNHVVLGKIYSSKHYLCQLITKI